MFKKLLENPTTLPLLPIAYEDGEYMDVVKTRIPGLQFFKMEMHEDERGFFARNFCANSIAEQDGFTDVSQANISFNREKGTIRGFHYQLNGHEEAKTVTVYRGSLHYKVLDLRKDSPTYLQHETFILKELSDVLQVPKGCTPGFQTLQDDVLLHYYVSNPYSKNHEAGIRYNDPYFKMQWPLTPTVISARDQSFPDFSVSEFPGLKGYLPPK
jgi:dTDP-4-dehydrorhamnose 3,5-epimerase